MTAPVLPLVALVAASFMWGLAWLPLKALERLGLSGIGLTFVACAAAAVPLVPWLARERRQWRGDARWLIAIAVLGGFANLAFTVAMIYGEVVRVMVLFYLLPVWGVLGGRLFLGERLDAPRVAAVAAALSGAVLILGGLEALTGTIAWTDWLAVGCGLSFAANNLVFRAHQQIPVASKTAAMLLGATTLALLLLAVGVQPWPATTASGWLAVLGYGLAWLLVATLGTQYGVTHLEAGRASVIIILELVTAVASAVWIGGERMRASEIAGAALILAAAVIEARRADPSANNST
jgi:drug/metabolite transporter (DMT)-like permease